MLRSDFRRVVHNVMAVESRWHCWHELGIKEADQTEAWQKVSHFFCSGK